MVTKNQLGLRKPKTRVLLVDDHPILRRGLAQLINQEADMTVCGEAEDAPKAFEAVSTLQPDVAVVEISLQRGNSIEVVKNITTRFPHLLHLLHYMHSEIPYAVSCLRDYG